MMLRSKLFLALSTIITSCYLSIAQADFYYTNNPSSTDQMVYTNEQPPQPTLRTSGLPWYAPLYMDVTAGYAFRSWNRDEGDTTIFSSRLSPSLNNVNGGFVGIVDAGYAFNNSPWGVEIGYIDLPTAKANHRNTGSQPYTEVSAESYATYGAARVIIPVLKTTEIVSKVGIAFNHVDLVNVSGANVVSAQGASVTNDYWTLLLSAGLLQQLNSYLSFEVLYTYLPGYHNSDQASPVTSNPSTPNANIITAGFNVSGSWMNDAAPRYLQTQWASELNHINTMYVELGGGYTIREWAYMTGTTLFQKRYASPIENVTGGWSGIGDFGYQFSRYFSGEAGYIYLPTAKSNYFAGSSGNNQSQTMPVTGRSYAVYLAPQLFVPFCNVLDFTGKLGLAWNYASIENETTPRNHVSLGARTVNRYLSPMAAIGLQYEISQNWFLHAQTLYLPGYQDGGNTQSTGNKFATPNAFIFTATAGYRFKV